MSILLRTQAQDRILSELRSKAPVPDPTFPSPILEYTVGRSVVVVGNDTSAYELARLLEDQLYLVEVVSADPIPWPAEMADTVIVLNRAVNEALLNEANNNSCLATVFFRCTLPGSVDQRFRVNDELVSMEKYADTVTFSATAIQRTLTDSGWQYNVALNDGHVLRAASDTEYKNGQPVLVAAENVVISGDTVGIIGGKVLRAISEASSSIPSLILRASVQDKVRDGEIVKVEDLLSRLGVTDNRVQAKGLLEHFVGSEEEAKVLLTERMNSLTLSSEADMDLDVRSFKAEAEELEGPHRVVGVLLEPEVPYGSERVWFSKETLSKIYMTDISEEINHKDPGTVGLKILRSFINGEDGELWDKAKAGSWLIECEVDEALYQSILQGEYQGFSIKGKGLIAG